MTSFEESLSQPVEGAEELAQAIRLFRASLDRGDSDGALRILREALYEPLLLRRRNARRCAELLDRLLADGPDALPPDASPRVLSFVLNALGLAYQSAGRPGLSLPPLERARTADEGGGANDRVVTLRTLAQGLLHCGRLRDAHEALAEAFSLAEAAGVDGQRRFLLVESWGAEAVCGRPDPGPLDEARTLCRGVGDRRTEGVMHSALAQRRLWVARTFHDEATEMPKTAWHERSQRLVDARSWADQAMPHVATALELAADRNVEADFLRAYRLRGVAALLRGNPGDFEAAAVDLSYVAHRALEAGVIEEAISARVDLAELGLWTGQHRAAARRVAEAQEILAGTGYRRLEADLEVVRSRSEQVEGRLTRAVEAVARAYELSWCDGPHFVYHWGLVAARRQLSALAATEPQVVEPSLGTYGARRGT